MENIWEVLIYALTCSISAAFILVIKKIFNDKLSPRWQYGIWSVLALRCIFPVWVRRGVLFPVPLWIEMLKSICEKGLNSAFSSEFKVLGDAWFMPLIKGEPKSITDWLLVIYAIGVAAVLLYYIFSYIRLRLILKKGKPASEENERIVREVSQKYGLKRCSVIEVGGLEAAFVCGVFKPILVLSGEKTVDEKIVLHELLHLKYKDALQSIIWCVFRAMHWCNPFMHYVFNRISNDMESLCDQRVLERLEGEERREYGAILLDMANEKYARFPGTSSVSNGGKNIARRIEAIVRFKKYPRGMALVSLCIVVFTASVLLSGSTYIVGQDNLRPMKSSELSKAMAVARIAKCDTIAGALDTYAKGLLLENGVYMAVASPKAEHELLLVEMLKSSEEGWAAYHVETGDELENVDKNSGYLIYNLERRGDGYSAYIAFTTYGEYNEETECYENGTVLIPVNIWYENGWVVHEEGNRLVYDHAFAPTVTLPKSGAMEIHRDTGTVSLGYIAEYEIENNTHDGYFDENPNFSAQFSYVMVWNEHEYDINTKTVEGSPKDYAGMEVVPLYDENEKYEFSNFGPGSGASSGYGGWNTEWSGADWDGIIKCGGGSGFGGVGVKPEELPKAYAVRLIWDGETVDEFILSEEEK